MEKVISHVIVELEGSLFRSSILLGRSVAERRKNEAMHVQWQRHFYRRKPRGLSLSTPSALVTRFDTRNYTETESRPIGARTLNPVFLNFSRALVARF